MKPNPIPTVRVFYRNSKESKEKIILNTNLRPFLDDKNEGIIDQAPYQFANKLDTRDEGIRVPFKIKNYSSVSQE